MITYLVTAALVVIGAAIPVLAYRMGYHAGRSDVAKEAVKSWEKQIEKAERRQERDYGYES